MGRLLQQYALCFALSMSLLCAKGAQITLAWDQNPETNLQSYILRYSQPGGFTNSLAVATNYTSASVTLPPGIYIFTLTARNVFGLESIPSNAVNGTNPPPSTTSTLTLTTQGSGTVAPALNGQSLTLGRSYTLVAVPGAGCVFTGWSGGVTSSSPTLQFVMSSNMVINAGFMTNPFPPVVGSYNGLFYEEAEVAPGSAGYFSLKTTSKGTYSGKVLLSGRSHGFTGHLAFDGAATNQIVRKGTNALTLQFQLSGNSNSIQGRLSDGLWDAAVLGDRAVFSKTNPAPFAGRFTLAIPGATNAANGPEGQSVGTLKIDNKGTATFAGAMADGSKVTQKTPLSSSGAWPLYASLYKGSGLLLSWQIVSNRVTDDLSGLLTWVRPGQGTSKYWPIGFSNDLAAAGSRYVAPVPLTRVVDLDATQIAFIGGNLSGGITNDITLDVHNKITFIGAPLSMSFSLGSGLFSGKVTDPQTGKPGVFRGVVLQKQIAGAGYLLGTNQSAQVVFGD